MSKEKYHIEYDFGIASKRSLWNHLTTPPGLSSWFADDVIIDGNVYTFKWQKEEDPAEVLDMKQELSIRYRWLSDCDYYFEFLIHTIELTNTIALEITDFAEPDEKMEAIELWDSQVDTLKRSLGL